MKRVLALLLIVSLLVVGLAAWFNIALHEKVAHGHSGDFVQVAPGLAPGDAIAELGKAGVVRHPRLLYAYIKWKHMGRLIKAGDYKFASPISALEVLEQLQQGGTSANKLTVVEGWNRFDIARAMASISSLHLKNERDALAYLSKISLIKDIDPTARNLEGYLYPETYLVYLTTKPEELVDKMVGQFRDVWKNKLARKAAKAKLSPHDAVTMASIIETEAKLKGERPLIASVLYNRLKKNMALGMDSTVVYASQLANKWRDDGRVYQSDLDLDSPYNTRMYKGLPPGPVSSPGLPSLEAAISPAQTTYLYYVRDPNKNNGAHNFYSDEAGFTRGVEALRAWERKQGRK